MSRLAPPQSSPIVKRDARMGGGGGAQDDVCPVCKSSRYLNNTLRFLVNPECYHKMCESCVDRIFSHGPAQCPISGCRRTLRKHRFREQTFEDIKVEREVDIRKKVAAVFNRREEEFENTRAYNDYLNDVEDITFNLVNVIDVEETNKRFESHRKAHEGEIKENKQLEQEEKINFIEHAKAEKQQARLRREAARREEEGERREVEENKKDMLNRLASGQDAEVVTKEGQQVQLKRRMDRQAATERQRQLQAGEARGGSSNLVIKGLKTRHKAEPEAPVDPFGGLSITSKYYTPQTEYVWKGVNSAASDPQHIAGGYDLGAFTRRMLCEAFSGLGVFVADEMTEREKATQEGESVAIVRAEIGVTDQGGGDPFS